MSEEDTGAPHFATGAEVEALLDKYARDRVGAHTRMQCKGLLVCLQSGRRVSRRGNRPRHALFRSA